MSKGEPRLSLFCLMCGNPSADFEYTVNVRMCRTIRIYKGSYFIWKFGPSEGEGGYRSAREF